MTTHQIGVATKQAHHEPLSIVVVGFSLSLFFVISYVLCLIGYLGFPGLPIYHAGLSIFLPGFELLTWQSFLLGLVESFAYGWYVAVILVPLYNFFIRWRAA
jgi:2TM family of unknown function (DUF5676)